MSYFDDASLVMIPSGYKDQKVYSVKPLDGSGDLTFSRASNATRVASNGLIEKVRTNYALYSQDFGNATWDKNAGITVTTGQTDPNGGTTAARVQYATSAIEMRQVLGSQSGLRIISIYIKGVSGESINIFDGISNLLVTFDGTWQRFSLTGNFSGVQVFSINTYAGTARDIYVAFAQAEEGDIATDYIATTTAAVSVGPVSGLPRLDYLNSSCPRLLLEPQRTNALLQSENLSSATWTKEGGTITANSTASPDGYSNADLFTEDTSTGNHRVYQAPISTTINQAVTFSVFAKYNGRQYIYLRTDNVTNFIAVFDIQNGTAGSVTSGATSKIENYGNGWYRCTLTLPATAAASVCEGLVGFLSGSSFSSASYTGNGTSGAYLWGFQGEVSASYATSYIPTLGTSVTRVGDAAYKGSISSLIGATEGVLFLDFIKPPTASSRTKIARTSALLTDGGNSFLQSINLDIETNGNLRANIVNTTTQVDIQTASYAAGTRIKMAFAYKANDCVLYINGTQIGTDTSCTIPVCTAYEIGSYETANTTQTNYVSQALLFTSRLSNSDLATLTSL